MEKNNLYFFLGKIILFSFKNFFNLIFINENKFWPNQSFFSLFLSQIRHQRNNSKIRNDKLIFVCPSYEKVYQKLKILMFFRVPVTYGNSISKQRNQKVFLVILRKINTEKLKKIHSSKGKMVFYIEDPLTPLDFFFGIKESSFLFLFMYPEKNNKTNLILNLKKPFLKIDSELFGKKNLFLNKKKTIWAKIRVSVAENFFFFWELKRKNLRKALIFSSTSVKAKKAKFLFYSINFKTEIIGPWLTKERILKRLKRFNSNHSGVLILSGDLDFSNYILNRVDTREISFCFFSENLNSNRKKFLF